jgi:phage terminase Nu1 subunit (DNA packaging protein)
MFELPPYYFRVRENGALVFRVDGETRSRRLELEPIAAVNLRSGEVKPQGDRALGAEDVAAIEAWIAQRRETVAAREIDDILRTVDHLNHTAHWAQSRATDAQLEAVTDALLLAMHDLRNVLTRRKADRLRKAPGADPREG